MKEINKCKRQLKRWEWLNKHLGTCLLAVHIPFIMLYLFLGPINFVAASACFGVAFVTLVTCGYVKICYADDTNVKILLEKKIAAMEDVTEEKLEVLAKSIENFKENNVVVKDEQTTKSLIKELTSIHKSAKKALKEKQNEEEKALLL